MQTLYTGWQTTSLLGMHQKVSVNGTTSDGIAVLSGVPQGSILGPLLFINDLASLSVSVVLQTILYADDLLLYQPISTSNDCALMKDIAAIEAWSSSTNLNFCLQGGKRGKSTCTHKITQHSIHVVVHKVQKSL